MGFLDNLLNMEDIGYFIIMEEQEEQNTVNVEKNCDFVGEEATQNNNEE